MSNQPDIEDFGALVKFEGSKITSINIFPHKKEVFVGLRSGNYVIMGYSALEQAERHYQQLLDLHSKWWEENVKR